MRYNKPEIVDSRNALEAIQGVQKGMPLPRDSMKINRTPSASEVAVLQAAMERMRRNRGKLHVLNAVARFQFQASWPS